MDNFTINFTAATANSTVLYIIDIVYIVTMTLGLLGNTLTICTIWKNRYLRTPMNISLVSLACCDIIVCFFVIPLRLNLYILSTGVFSLRVICKADVFLKSVCDYVQLSMFVATSFERYKSIADPFQSKGKVKRIVIVVIATWTSCVCCGGISGVLFYDGATFYPCSQEFTYVQYNFMHFREGFVSFPFGIICLILVCVFYFLMIKTLSNHTQKMKKRFKPRLYTNKVKPSSLKSKVTQEVKTNEIPVQSFVAENNESNVGEHFRPATTASFVPVNIPKTRTDDPDAVNVNNKSLQRTMSNGKTISIDMTEYNSMPFTQHMDRCKCGKCVASVDYDTIMEKQRRISIRKTRERIFDGQGCFNRFPSLAKHVVLLNAHKQRSLTNLRKRKEESSCKSTFTEESKEEQVCLQETALTTQREDNQNMSQQNYSKLSRSHSAVSGVFDYSLNSSSLVPVETNVILNNSKVAEKVMHYEQQILTEENEIDANPAVNPSCVADDSGHVVNNVVKDCKPALLDNHKSLPPESSHKHDFNIDDSPKQLNIPNDIKNIQNGDLADRSKNTSENNLDLNQSNKTVSPMQNGEISNLNESKENTDQVQSQQRDNVEDNAQTVNNIDVVDFDGTVHKGVRVEGAVVGAVCVMNTSNKLEGRRKVEMRAAKRIAVLIGSFVALWLPLPIIAAFVSSRKQISSADLDALLVSSSISSVTVAINPILNLLLNKQLRSAAIVLLKKTASVIRRTFVG